MKSMRNWNSNSQLSGIHNVSSFHNAYTVYTNSYITWILDSGVTDYIVSDVSLISQSKPINVVLHLPNNTTANITHVGEANITIDIVLTDVLCVPSFQCNLVSISKFTADSSTSITFSKSSCML